MTRELYYRPNPAFAKDAYKTGHLFQYPPGTEYIYSNMTPRGANHFHAPDFNGKVVSIGWRSFIAELREFWEVNFFSLPSHWVLQPYQKMIDSALGHGVVTTDHLKELHELGYLPLRVKALPEGVLVNLRVPTMTVINTHPKFSWIVNFLETIWANETWQMATCATIAYEYRRQFERFAEMTGSPMEFVPFQGHDFSARGMSGHTASRRAGVGHLASFVGSDTLEAGHYATHFFNADWDMEMILVAPPATEHAVMCLNYAIYGELETYRRLITEVYPSGMVAIVSDTIDLWNVLTQVAPSLKAEIMAREDGVTGPGKVVFRPDSGNPADILCGLPFEKFVVEDGEDSIDHAFLRGQIYDREFGTTFQSWSKPFSLVYMTQERVSKEIRYWQATYPAGAYGEYPANVPEGVERSVVLDPYKVGETEPYAANPEEKGAFQVLWEIFGGTLNERGFKVLDSHVGLVYGDSITLQTQQDILQRLYERGFASSNAVLGIGSFTYQYNTRDTFGWAVKATWAEVNGRGVDLQKTPATDSGTKHSAKGLMRVELVAGEYVLHQAQTPEQEAGGELRVIFEDGQLFDQTSLGEIRQRLWPTYRESPFSTEGA